MTLLRSIELSLLNYIQISRILYTLCFIAQFHTTFIIVVCSLLLTSLYFWSLSSHYNSLKFISCLLQKKNRNLVVFSLKCLKLVKRHHPLKQPYPLTPLLHSKPYHIYLPLIMTALHYKSPLKNSMVRNSYNGPNQPNFSLKVKRGWVIL